MVELTDVFDVGVVVTTVVTTVFDVFDADLFFFDDDAIEDVLIN